MKRFRAGVIGVGFIGAVHIEQIRRLGDVEVAALAKTANPREKADALNVPGAYTDYREMIDREDLDVVHICTPNSTHFEMAMYALEKGLHVVCEKPMTCTVAEAEELNRKAKETGLVNAINFNCRFYPGQQHLLFSPQRSTKIRDISEKNSTTKSNRTRGSSNQRFVEPKVRSRKRKRKSGCCPKNLFDLFDLAVKISSILVISQRFESKCCCPALLPDGVPDAGDGKSRGVGGYFYGSRQLSAGLALP